MFKRVITATILTGLVTLFGGLAVASATNSTGSPPSGQRMYGNTTFSTTTGHFTGGASAQTSPCSDDVTSAPTRATTPVARCTCSPQTSSMRCLARRSRVATT